MASTSVNIQTQSDNNELQSPSATAVRSNGLLLLRSSWSNISRVNKFMLISSIFFIISQIAVSIVILLVYKEHTCDKPLDTYLIIYTVRIFLLLPLLIYQYLSRPITSEQLLQQQQQRRHEINERRMHRNGSTISSHTNGSHASTSLHQQITPPTRNSNNNTIKEWCNKAKSLLDLFGILWFIVGNYLIFTTYDCSFMAPAYYYTVLTWVLFGYIIVLIPVILCASVIFCLPCVLVILQALQINNVPGVSHGATQTEINKIPVYKYKENENQTNNNGLATPLNIKKNHQPKKSWLRRMFLKYKKSNNDLENDSYPPITIQPIEDALCSICLCEYENDELICKLWCKHHFHKDCLHQWVGLNTLCPLCKQDFRGKKYNENNNREQDEESSTEITESR